jgi:salicylate hydroxylase
MTILQDSLAASNPLRVLIIGCGIGGLACAIPLRRAGHEVIVLERVPAVQEVCS